MRAVAVLVTFYIRGHRANVVVACRIETVSLNHGRETASMNYRDRDSQ